MEHTEIQRCPRKLAWMLSIAAAFSMSMILLTSVLLAYDARAGYEEVWIPALIVAMMIGGLGILFYFSRLLVRISETGIFVRFSPFQIKGRLFPWNDIVSITIRRVSPFAEFGGWGIRWNLLGKRLGYVWNGEYGIELSTVSGRVVVVTIYDIDGACRAVNTYATSDNTLVIIQDRSIT